MSNQPKLARRKVTTDLGRDVMTKERQRLAREQAAEAERMVEEAKRKINKQAVIRKQVKPEQIAVQRGLAKRIAAVLQTEGVEARLTIRCADQMSAWTDFEQIVVNYRMHEDVRLLAAIIRGESYHEAGHCRFTLPFIQLIELAGLTYDAKVHNQYHKAWNMLEDQRMETAVVSDSPRKAAYFTPVIMTEMTENISLAAANWPLLIWRKYLSVKIRKGARTLFVAKHNLMGLNGEELAKGWERAVNDYVTADNAPAMWAAVLTAHELLKITNHIPGANGDAGHDRQYTERKDDLDDALIIPIDPGMLGEDDEDGTDTGQPPVIDTTDPEVAEHLGKIIVAIFSHPETLLRVVYVAPTPSGQTTEGSGSSPEPTDEDGDEGDESDSDEDDSSDSEGGCTLGSGSKDADKSDEAEEEDEGGDSGQAKGDEDEDDDEGDEGDESEGTSDGSNKFANDGDRKSGQNPDREGGAHGKQDEDAEVDPDVDYRDRSKDDELTEEALQEAAAEAAAERDADEALNGDVQAFQDALDTRVSDLMPYQTHASADLQAAAAAHNLATELEQSFHAATMDKAPQWQEQQRRGIVNVMRYITRQPADMEFFRQWTEDDAPGFNLAVSIMLDYSGSMGGYTEELAQAGYAAKLACDKLGIPCTVTLWDTGAQVLWDANEPADYLPVIVAHGATEPTVALADLVNQRYEKAQHVVLIMTDGEWQDNAGKAGFLATYAEQGRVFIGCGFNSGYVTSADALANTLRRYGCDEAYALKTLMELPPLLEQTLIAVS